MKKRFDEIVLVVLLSLLVVAVFNVWIWVANAPIIQKYESSGPCIRAYNTQEEVPCEVAEKNRFSDIELIDPEPPKKIKKLPENEQ